MKIWSKQLLFAILPEIDEDPFILVKRRPITPLYAGINTAINYLNTPMIIADTLSGEED